MSTPLKSIRTYCLWCCCDSAKEIRLCPSVACPVYPLRFGRGVKGVSALKSIRLKCRDCVCDELRRIKECFFDGIEEELCGLHFYRMGKNPKLKGKGDPESLRKWRENQKNAHPRRDSESPTS